MKGTISSNFLRSVVPSLFTRSVSLGPAPTQGEGITELHTEDRGSMRVIVGGWLHMVRQTLALALFYEFQFSILKIFLLLLFI